MTGLRRTRQLRRLVRRIGLRRVVATVTLVQRPLLGLVWLLVRRVRRDERLVVLGSPLDRFADNAAHLFLHMADRSTPELTPVWITGSPAVTAQLRANGYRAELRWSWAGIRTCARAGTFVYSGYRSDVNQWLAAGARAICLWHGLPIKRIEAAVVVHGRPRQGLLARLEEAGREPPPDVLLSSTAEITQCFVTAFRVSAEQCWELGYPRNDHLLDTANGPHDALIGDATEWHSLHRAQRVVGLFLTWRDDKADDAVDEELLRRLADVCGTRGALLAYKAHYNVAPAAIAHEHCVLVPADADLHTYLGLCDVLITDYSSVALDFLLLARPTVYYVPDLDRYAATRGFWVHPQSLPGTLSRDAAALLEALASLLDDPASGPDAADVEPARRRIWGDYDGRASADIVARLRQDLRSREIPAARTGR